MAVAVAVGVSAGVAAAVGLGTAVAAGVDIGVSVAGGNAVGVGVGVAVAVAVGVGVSASVGAGEGVAVAVGVSVVVAVATSVSAMGSSGEGTSTLMSEAVASVLLEVPGEGALPPKSVAESVSVLSGTRERLCPAGGGVTAGWRTDVSSPQDKPSTTIPPGAVNWSRPRAGSKPFPFCLSTSTGTLFGTEIGLPLNTSAGTPFGTEGA